MKTFYFQNKLTKNLRFIVECYDNQSIVAHTTGQNSTCISDFKRMYISCINQSSWFVNIRGVLPAPIDQIYCYGDQESKEILETFFFLKYK